ncbi:MAG: RNA polymerase sigma factor [Bacteroidetes bacterium]|nr:RNA polymerase sigma factor [Bacteroidota bacterium]
MNPIKNVSALIEAAKKGQQQAFSSLLDLYWQEVLAFHLKRNVNENDAEDICIRTFSKAFEKINTYDANYTFKTWLITISKNVYIDFLRKKNAVKNIDMEQASDIRKHEIADESLTQEDELIREQNLSNLLACIKKLKPDYREIINLRYFKELSYKEIAAVKQEPVNNVKIKLLRAKKLLAEIIKNQGDHVS